jgi:hypothetical protein
MVARAPSQGLPDPDRPPEGGPIADLYTAWRHAVTEMLRAPGRAVRAAGCSRPALVLRAGAAYVAHPAATVANADARTRDRLTTCGGLAFAVGIVTAFALSAALREPPARAFLTAAWTITWAITRYLIMKLATRRLEKGRTLEWAWAPALIPFAGAVAFPLGIAALASSAYLTYAGLTGLTVGRRDATRAVALAFGGQALVEVAAWLARGGLVALAAYGV